MSRQQQINFLEKLNKELNRKSAHYRRHNANKRVQHMTISLRAIERGLEERLKKDFKDVPSREQFISEFLSDVNPHIRSFVAKAVRKIRALEKTSDTVHIKKQGENFLAIFSPELNAKGNDRDIFKKAYRTYEKDIKVLAVQVNEVLGASVAKAKKYRPGQIWNFEHNNLKGVVETMVTDVTLKALEGAGVGTIDEVLYTLKLIEPELELEIFRDLDGEQMEVFIGSAVLNSAEARVSANRKKALQKALEKALDLLNNDPKLNFVTMQGSDSIETAKRKKVIKSTVKDSFGSKKDVSVTTENLTINYGAKHTKIKPKVRRTHKGQPKSSNKRTKLKVGQGPSTEPLKLLKILNAELPKHIMKNMHEPALVNRTGRFAGSVKVTDVVTTRQGYPSFGFTYQLYPYQTFEPGFAQGSIERDPRRIINQSIREIAAKFAIGRFYTRRV